MLGFFVVSPVCITARPGANQVLCVRFLNTCLCLQGFGELPQHCGQMMIGFFLLALAMSLLRDLVPIKYSVFIPIPMAMAIPFYVGANVAVDICIGALVKAYWYWTSSDSAPGKASHPHLTMRRCSPSFQWQSFKASFWP